MSLQSPPPPPGYKPGETRAPLVWDIIVPLGGIAIIFVCLRLYVRVCLVRSVGKDDWLLVAAAVFMCGVVGATLWAVGQGIGKHYYDWIRDPKSDPRKLLPSGIITAVFFCLCACCVQCSILAFYLRIGLAEIGGRRMRRTIYALMGFSILNNTSSSVLQIVFTMLENYLMERNYFKAIWFTHGVLGTLTDLIIWCIPLPTIFSVMHNLSTRKKVLLALEFAVGMLSWISSILRISLWRYAADVSNDPTYNAPILYVLYTSEVALAICCASVVALRPLVVKMTKAFDRLRGKAISPNKSKVIGYEFRESPDLARPKGYGSGTGSRVIGSKGGYATVDQELVKWKDVVLDVESPGPALGTQLQVPTAAHTRPHCNTRASSESMVSLTNADTNSPTNYPRPLF